MSIRAIITDGFGSFGTVADVVRMGYGAQAVAVVVDTHDGYDHDIKRKRDDDEFRERRERMRSQLEAAFNDEYGIVAEQALSEFIEPQLSDAALKSPIERVDWNLVLRRYGEVEKKISELRKQRLMWEREQENEDDLLLLS